MKKNIFLLTSLFYSIFLFAQNIHLSCQSTKKIKFEVFTQKTGLLLGLQQGKFTSFEMGLEHQWKKIKLVSPYTYAVKGNLEYNFMDNVMGYKVGAWTRQGRLALTYGLNMGYFTDFEQDNFGVTPAIGLKLLGFHFENGYNFIFGKQKVENINFIYVSVRYFFANNRKMKVKTK